MVQEITEEQINKPNNLLGKEIIFNGERLSSLGNEVIFYVERGQFYK